MVFVKAIHCTTRYSD